MGGFFILTDKSRLILISFFLLFSLPLVADRKGSAGSDIPSDLRVLVEALLEAAPPDRDAACDRLIDAYLPLIKAGRDFPIVDKAIVDSISLESRASAAARMAIGGIFSDLQEACIARNDAENLAGMQADFLASAKGLYQGLKLLAEKHPASRAEWAQVAVGLREGWRYFPSLLYAGQLETAFKNSGNRRGVFEFKAYRYLDESRPNPVRCAGLFLRWLTLPDKRPFGDELAAIKHTMKNDIMRTSPGVVRLPDFGGERFFTVKGEPRSLDFHDPKSTLCGVRAVFIFFETTCGYCFTELGALGRIVPGYQKKSDGHLAVVGLKLPTRLPPAISALAPFEDRLALPFPLLQNDASGMREAYGVRAVPLLLFLDERGVPLWTVALHGQGRIEEKLSWFLDDLLADAAFTRRPPSSGKGRKLHMDLYAEPSRIDCTSFLEKDITALEKKHDTGIEVAVHDLSAASTAQALTVRLAALRASLTALPVAIVGRRVLQGFPAILRELPEILDLSAGSP